jgi:mannose-6-phosphate isomerase-like protein (cupin superfamily)
MPKKISAPAVIQSAGNKPKKIEEFIGRVNNRTEGVSIARMTSPSGWVEPGQRPEFEEYTVVLKGTLQVRTENEILQIRAQEAVVVSQGEWVQYSTPDPEGAEYLAVCLPAFSPQLVHRDGE